jgi:hypothetical protein
MLARVDNAILVPVFLAGLWMGVDRATTRKALARTGLFLIPLVAVGLFIHVTNQIRARGLEGGGYSGEGFSTPLGVGLFGLLFSPSHGVFWFSPPIVVAVFYATRFHRRHPRLSFVVWATVALKLFLFAKWWNWFGGWSWGSRFLAPVVPLALLGLLEPLSRWPVLRRTEKALLLAACAAGLLVQAGGVLVAQNQFHNNVQFLAGQAQGIADREHSLIYGPTFSPLLGNWPIILQGNIDWFALRFGGHFPPAALFWIFGALAALLLIGAVGVVRAWMRGHWHGTGAPEFVVPTSVGVSEEPAKAGTTNRPAKAGTTNQPAKAGTTNQYDPEFVVPTSVGVSNLCAPVPAIARRAGLLLLVANVAFFAVVVSVIRANGPWRIERQEMASGPSRSESKGDDAVYLDDRIVVPPGALGATTQWVGALEVPTTGDYTFYTVLHGACSIQIEGFRPIEINAPADRASRRIDLPAVKRGLHAIEVRYAAPLPGDGLRPTTQSLAIPRLMQLYWTIPGGGEYETVIGPSWLYPSRPTAARRFLTAAYRLKFGAVLVSVLAFWWIWIHVRLRPVRTGASSGVAQ